MNRKYLKILFLYLIVFLIAFFYVDKGVYRQILIYFSILFGMFMSFNMPQAIYAVNGLCLVLLAGFSSPHWLSTTAGLGLLIVGTSVIPAYFERLMRRQKEYFGKTKFTSDDKVKILEEKLKDMDASRSVLEQEIEKINQIYVLGRELVEHIQAEDVAEHLNRILVNRPGIKSIAIFSKEQDGWGPLYFSEPSQKGSWSEFVSGASAIMQEKSFRFVEPPLWLGGLSVIFLPVQLEKEMLACVFLACENEFADYYQQRASIFIPQFALGVKRTRLFAEVEERSRVDGLTELYLRRYFLGRLQSEIQRAKRYSSSFALLMADIDHFKMVNDTYGHLAGDQVLAGIAKIISGCVQPGDLVGRYGGEEFIIFLPSTTHVQALSTAQSIVEGVSAKEFIVSGIKHKTSISIGISYYPSDAITLKELLSLADKALYWVKNNGRNGFKEFRDIKEK